MTVERRPTRMMNCAPAMDRATPRERHFRPVVQRPTRGPSHDCDYQPRSLYSTCTLFVGYNHNAFLRYPYISKILQLVKRPTCGLCCGRLPNDLQEPVGIQLKKSVGSLYNVFILCLCAMNLDSEFSHVCKSHAISGFLGLESRADLR